MKKTVLLTLLLSSPIFAKDSLLYNELLLLNNPTLNSGHYRDKNLYKIDNYSIGRKFLFNNLETSLYLSYSKNSNDNKYLGLKSSIGYFKNINKTLYFYITSFCFILRVRNLFIAAATSYFLTLDISPIG